MSQWKFYHWFIFLTIKNLGNLLFSKVPWCWDTTVEPRHHSSQMQGKVNKNNYNWKIFYENLFNCIQIRNCTTLCEGFTRHYWKFHQWSGIYNSSIQNLKLITLCVKVLNKIYLLVFFLYTYVFQLHPIKRLKYLRLCFCPF